VYDDAPKKPCIIWGVYASRFAKNNGRLSRRDKQKKLIIYDFILQTKKVLFP
jgi:hypothetical protein